MDIVKRVTRMREVRQDLGERGQRIALVPTMGYLHDGHLGLVRRGREMADRVVVSLFVNPLQFSPKEDFAAYPRDLNRDTDLCKKEDVDVLFVPEAQDLYPTGFATRVSVAGLEDRLCGRSRPGHFAGVATVVTKLVNIVAPHFLIMGQKDGQQAVIVRRLVRDLNLAAELVVAPTAREADGLAMSSRNTYLGAADREAAAVIHRALVRAEGLYAAGERDAARLVGATRTVLEAEARAVVEYVELVSLDALEPVSVVDRESMLAVAACLGGVRLIDNLPLGRSPAAS